MILLCLLAMDPPSYLRKAQNLREVTLWTSGTGVEQLGGHTMVANEGEVMAAGLELLTRMRSSPLIAPVEISRSGLIRSPGGIIDIGLQDANR